jgi:hypothetical protein
MMYAYTSYKSWRCIGDASEALPGESVSDVLPGPTQSEAFDDYVSTVSDGVSAWLSAYVHDNFGYDNIVSAASYAGDKSPKFNTEGIAAKAWRSDCFNALYAAMPTYQALPPDQWPSIDYITAHLPQPSAYTWEPAP